MSKEFNYESDMKDYYKSDDIAEEYYEKYNKKSNWRGRIIANRERNAVKYLLNNIDNKTVLEIPTGTGKLAPLFAQIDSSVLACDISENMLKISKNEYKKTGHSKVQFQAQDAENLRVQESFDVAVCLRLLHRVPKDVKINIISELGRVAEYVIVSTGIESPFHKIRRNIREKLIGGDTRGHCYESYDETVEIFSQGFEITDSKPVLPFLSQEYVFLLKPIHE